MTRRTKRCKIDGCREPAVSGAPKQKCKEHLAAYLEKKREYDAVRRKLPKCASGSAGNRCQRVVGPTRTHQGLTSCIECAKEDELLRYRAAQDALVRERLEQQDNITQENKPMAATFQSLRDGRLPKAEKAVSLLANLVKYDHTEEDAKDIVNALGDAIDDIDEVFAKKWGWEDDATGSVDTGTDFVGDQDELIHAAKEVSDAWDGAPTGSSDDPATYAMNSAVERLNDFMLRLTRMSDEDSTAYAETYEDAILSDAPPEAKFAPTDASIADLRAMAYDMSLKDLNVLMAVYMTRLDEELHR